MATVDVLVEGFTSDDGKGDGNETTFCTMTLVRDGDIVMVVDPGTLKSQDIMKDALAKHGLKVKDVNTVFLTHSHMDHFGSIGMFPGAKTVEFYGQWQEDRVEDRNNKLSDDIEVIETPGHAKTGLTLLVKTDKGTVAICGDVFWKENFPEKDPYADEPEEVEKSRKKVLEAADYIVPGHAGIYEIKK